MKAVLRWVAPFFVVLLAAELLVLGPRRDDLEAQQVMLERLKDDYLNKKKQAVNLDLLREQQRQVDAEFGKALREVPNRYDTSFIDVLSAARSRRLRVEELRPERSEDQREFYAFLSVYLKLSGRYHDLGRFAGDIAAAPASLTLTNLSLDAGPGPGQVSMAATLRVFRYLDDEEVAAAQKRARASKGGKR